MLEHLFGSKTRLKLLRVFFRHPTNVFFVRELTRLLDAHINAIRRELELLVQSGIITETEKHEASEEGKVGATLRKYYALNKKSVLFPEMHALLLKAHVLGEEAFVRTLQEKGGHMRLLLLTGQFTGDHRASTDILIVGVAKAISLARIISQYEKEFGFEIRYTTMTEDEFFDRRNMMDKFLYSLFEADHVKAVNELGI